DGLIMVGPVAVRHMGARTGQRSGALLLPRHLPAKNVDAAAIHGQAVVPERDRSVGEMECEVWVGPRVCAGRAAADIAGALCDAKDGELDCSVGLHNDGGGVGLRFDGQVGCAPVLLLVCDDW